MPKHLEVSLKADPLALQIGFTSKGIEELQKDVDAMKRLFLRGLITEKAFFRIADCLKDQIVYTIKSIKLAKSAYED